jgi:sugar phosphate isomerase/epimerase
MKILFSTGSLSHLPLKEIFLLAGRTGFDGCDLVIQQHLDHQGYRETLRECLDILPAYALHVPFERLRSWGSQVEALKKSIGLAKEFSIPVVNFHPPSWLYLEIAYLRWFRKIRDFQEELGCVGVCVALENMPLVGEETKRRAFILNDFNDMLKFGMERNLYFTFDTTHLATFDRDIIAAFFAFYKTGRLKHLHLSDHSGHRSHLFPGAGRLPLAELLKTARTLGYDQAVSLEVAPAELSSTGESLAEALREASAFLKRHAAGQEHG